LIGINLAIYLITVVQGTGLNSPGGALLNKFILVGSNAHFGLFAPYGDLAHDHQWWRLVTAHVVHLDVRHALLNDLGLALVWALFARDYSLRQWAAVVLGAVVAIDAGLWLCDSTLEWYVGSSGALHGVMAAGALAHLRRGERDGALLSVALVAKLGYEHWAGALPFSASLPVVVSAHLYGVIGGSAVAVFVRPRARSAVGPSL